MTPEWLEELSERLLCTDDNCPTCAAVNELISEARELAALRERLAALLREATARGCVDRNAVRRAIDGT